TNNREVSWLEKIPIVAKLQRRGHPLSHGAALQKLILGLREFVVRSFERRDIAAFHYLGHLLIDLQTNRGCIERGLHQSHDRGNYQRGAHHTENQPPAFDDDVQILEKIDLEICPRPPGRAAIIANRTAIWVA